MWRLLLLAECDCRFRCSLVLFCFVLLPVLFLCANCQSCVQKSGLKPQVVGTYEEAYSLVLSKRCDYMFATSGNIISNANPKYCGRLSAVGAKFYDVGLSFLLPKNSSLTTPLSKATLALRDSGKLQSIGDFLSKQKCSVYTGATVVSLSTRYMRSLLIILRGN
jgi:hypothetical protein